MFKTFHETTVSDFNSYLNGFLRNGFEDISVIKYTYILVRKIWQCVINYTLIVN